LFKKPRLLSRVSPKYPILIQPTQSVSADFQTPTPF
jgi:hypothetical protein